MDPRDSGVDSNRRWGQLDGRLGCLSVFGFVAAAAGGVGDSTESAHRAPIHDLKAGHVCLDPMDLTRSLPVAVDGSRGCCADMYPDMVDCGRLLSEGGRP